MSFKENFLWGAASSAYQIEGGYNEDGKGLNVWDVHCTQKGRVAHGETGQVACDHYHRYKEDVALMKQIGINSYRFSINWARIFPEGCGKVNEAGLAFYSDLVDELLKAGIEPFVTLFHWDYPEALNQKGAWLNEESPIWFEEYAKAVVDALSDRVQYWMTFNEPQILVELGYRTGVFAPFEKHTRKEVAQMAHNVLLAHGRAVNTIRKYAKKKPIIGFAFTAPSVIPKSTDEAEIEKARKETFSISAFGEEQFLLSNSFWADPIFLGDYSEETYKLLQEDMPVIHDGDMSIISAKVDFFGANIYQSIAPEVGKEVYAKNCYIGCPRTMLGWAITPEVIYWSAKFMTERYHVPFLISENGMAGMDWIHLDGKVHDAHRIDYLHRHIKELKRAAQDGIDIMGYMTWSIMDNFEWASGYDMRFGLIYVDYTTQERTLKDSAHWYKKVVETNGAEL
jgi:beta-glucosidase